MPLYLPVAGTCIRDPGPGRTRKQALAVAFGDGEQPGPLGHAVERRRLAMRSRAGRSSVVASPRSNVFAGRGVGDGGMMHGTRRGATVTDLWSEQLLEQVRLALKAEGCRVEVEIVRLLGAAPGQRNWEIATIGPNTEPADMRRRVVDVQTRLGEKFQLRSRRRVNAFLIVFLSRGPSGARTAGGSAAPRPPRSRV